ncbi:U3 small nucleolar ribonucleoprotein protein MPP10 [Vanessa cardui]|uniref:U3 small nucleolar ribonucleoprotein protein MPP10 n=1 Tax=Vanessa cardui TaxID=171605 RepID=UPI001F12D6FD|nr:U3 small nucleolar ribonucleoprotein protein MPP10 [Vanessa cardui]
MANAKMQNMIDKFSTLTEKPVKYLTVQDDIKKDIKNLVKSLYDFTKSQEQDSKTKQSQALKKIIVNDFDEEQIWQQIEIQNSQCWDQLVWDVANSMSSKKDLTFPIQFPEDRAQPDEACSENLSDNENKQLEPHNVKKSKVKSKNKVNKQQLNTRTSVVDDQFFKLQDMEKFLVNEEKTEAKGKKSNDDDDEGSIDMFDEIESEASDNEGGKEMMYSDFFNDENGDENAESYDEESNEGDIDRSSKKKVRFAEPNSDESEIDDENTKTDEHKKPRFGQPDAEESESDDEDMVSQVNGEKHVEEKKSEFELRQQRLKERISKLEEKTLTEAPWQLKGEIDATKRPQNSLLEEVLDFDLTTRPPPTITEQTTVTLEGLIKQRVKDKAWDDVIRKEKPVDDQLLFKKPEVLDQSKSKLSLAQVYETEYLKQKQALSGEVEDEKEPESHTEIRTAMSKLFSKLDALCHYHYTPKAPQAEVKIISNTPAISMEEVAPIAVSDAALLAPEEVKKKRKGDLMSKEERTQTDKNRERRKKKKLQRKKGQVMKVTEHRNTKKGVESSEKSLKTSKAFFQQLNDEATSLIKSKTKKNVKK